MAEEVISSRVIFEGRILKLRVDTVRTVDGRETTREVVEHAACVAVVAVDEKGDILLVRQYRDALGKELLEIPAGGIDKGESPEAAVVREMQEETGFRPRQVTRLCGFYTTPGFCDEYLHLYLATGLEAGPPLRRGHRRHPGGAGAAQRSPGAGSLRQDRGRQDHRRAAVLPGV